MDFSREQKILIIMVLGTIIIGVLLCKTFGNTTEGFMEGATLDKKTKRWSFTDDDVTKILASKDDSVVTDIELYLEGTGDFNDIIFYDINDKEVDLVESACLQQ